MNYRLSQLDRASVLENESAVSTAKTVGPNQKKEGHDVKVALAVQVAVQCPA